MIEVDREIVADRRGGGGDDAGKGRHLRGSPILMAAFCRAPSVLPDISPTRGEIAPAAFTGSCLHR
jgi:hypothetical protein